jgi:hypothetical protein
LAVIGSVIVGSVIVSSIIVGGVIISSVIVGSIVVGTIVVGGGVVGSIIVGGSIGSVSLLLCFFSLFFFLFLFLLLWDFILSRLLYFLQEDKESYRGYSKNKMLQIIKTETDIPLQFVWHLCLSFFSAALEGNFLVLRLIFLCLLVFANPFFFGEKNLWVYCRIKFWP